MKPRVKLQGYDSTKYNVLVALKSGTVYVASSYSYKAAAYRMAHQRSPSKDSRTYRAVVLRPGGSLVDIVNWLIEGLASQHENEKREEHP